MDAIVRMVDASLSKLALAAMPQTRLVRATGIKRAFRRVIIARKNAPAKACIRLLRQKWSASY